MKGEKVDTIRHVEVMQAMLAAAFEANANTLSMYGGHRMRPEMISFNLKLISALYRTIDSMEAEHIAHVESEMEEILGSSAAVLETLCKAQEVMPSLPAIKEFKEIAQEGHGEVTKTLAEDEEKCTNAIHSRFEKMRQEVRKIEARFKSL